MTFTNINLFLSILTFIVIVANLVVILLKQKQVAKKVESSVEGAKSLVDGVGTILAPTPIGPVVHVVDEALQAAEVGVKFAEQLYTSGNAIDRKAEAVKYVNSTLEELGVKVTPRLSGIIDGAIEAAVYTLPPTDHSAVQKVAASTAPTAPVAPVAEPVKAK